MNNLEQYEEYEDYDEYEEYQDENEEEDNYSKPKTGDEIISIFSIISTWFIRIGIVIAAILLLVFLISGKLFTAVLYIIGLAVAFVLGYGFMYCLDHFIFTDNS